MNSNEIFTVGLVIGAISIIFAITTASYNGHKRTLIGMHHEHTERMFEHRYRCASAVEPAHVETYCNLTPEAEDFEDGR